MRNAPGPSAAVRRTQAEPLVLDGVVVLFRLVFLDRQGEFLHRKPARRRQYGVACDDDVTLGGDEVDLRGDHVGLGVEHVERGALTDIALPDDTVEGELRGGNQFAVGTDDPLERPGTWSRRR